MKEWPRISVVERGDDYLRVEFTSALWRYVDDVEFHLPDGTHEIRMRSASRVGYSDLGANRDRLEELRALFEAR